MENVYDENILSMYVDALMRVGVDSYISNHERQQAIVSVFINSGNHMKVAKRCVICITSKAK